MKKNRKVVMIKRYTITHTIYDDNYCHETRTNTGFNSLELMGLLTKVQLYLATLWTPEPIEPDKTTLKVKKVKK